MRLQLSDNDCIIVVPIADAKENLFALTRQEIEQLNRIASPHRRNEWSTWRKVVREELGMQTKIGYDCFGAPQIIVSDRETVHISVSHSRLLVAVMFSQRKCGIDIEENGRNFEHVASKYLSGAELELPENKSSIFMAVAWCAKEAAYKFSEEHNENLKESIMITGCDMGKKMLNVSISGEQNRNVMFFEYEGHIICHLSDTA